jgi:hypothetical protein
MTKSLGNRAGRLGGLSLVMLALTGCASQPVAPRTTAPAASSAAVPDLAAEPAPTWRTSLKPKADTFYLGRGALPTPVIDKTTASSSGRLVLRVECDKGRFAPSISVDGTSRSATFTCGGKRQEQFLTDIRKGQHVVVHAEGDDGTQFATELVIHQGADE